VPTPDPVLHTARVTSVESMAARSSRRPFAVAAATAPRSPGVYLARQGEAGDLVYVGMAGERREQGLRGRLDRVSLGVVAGQQVESGGTAVADQSAGQAQESEVVESLAVVAADQAAKAGGPLDAAFDDVAVPAEPFR
jgi:hypothetical protein